ncbi:MAG: thiaminase II [Salaquimonas sp.]
MTLFNSLKADCLSDWQSYTQHEFVRQMGEGTLPEAAFREYLVQDYLFLIQFSRAYALSIYKSRSVAEMRQSLEGLKAILDVEMDLHVRICERWGISQTELEDTAEARETIAYTRFVLDAGNAGDLLDLFVSLAPCMIGYGEIGLALKDKATPDNPYAEWINEYASDGYQEVANGTIDYINRLGEELSSAARYPKLKTLFGAASRLEADFWQMGLNAATSDC